jgi:hypothetical protein
MTDPRLDRQAEGQEISETDSGLLDGIRAGFNRSLEFAQVGMAKVGAVKDGVTSVLNGAKDAKVEWDNAANNNAAFKNIYLVREAAGNVRRMNAKEYNQNAHLVTVLEINGKPVAPQSNRSTWAA